MDHHGALALLLFLLLQGRLQVNGSISPKVVALQQVLTSELVTLERSAFITNAAHASSTDGSAFSRLRKVFHDFERQNQESITAILRVLALVDHTLENTVQSCEKVFHLPSLESDNVLFGDVTRPLLLLVEKLCQQISAEELDQLELTMQSVQQEASRYRVVLDDTKQYMQMVLNELPDSYYETFSASDILNAKFAEIEQLNSTIRSLVQAATTNMLARQHAQISDEKLASDTSIRDGNIHEIVTNFMAFLENETELLTEDLGEQIDDWLNETAYLYNLVVEEVVDVPYMLMEAPIESFLQHETSLKCLAKYYNPMALQTLWMGLSNIIKCFQITVATERPFEIVKHLLGIVGNDIELIFQDIFRCQDDRGVEDDSKNLNDIPNCYEMAAMVLEMMQEVVNSKMDEIYTHVENAMYFNELKMESCVYFMAKELMQDVAEMNRSYQTCNKARNSVQNILTVL